MTSTLSSTTMTTPTTTSTTTITSTTSIMEAVETVYSQCLDPRNYATTANGQFVSGVGSVDDANNPVWIDTNSEANTREECCSICSQLPECSASFFVKSGIGEFRQCWLARRRDKTCDPSNPFFLKVYTQPTNPENNMNAASNNKCGQFIDYTVYGS